MWLYVSILLERGKFYTDSKECPAIGRGILYATFLPNIFDRVTLVCLLKPVSSDVAYLAHLHELLGHLQDKTGTERFK